MFMFTFFTKQCTKRPRRIHLCLRRGSKSCCEPPGPLRSYPVCILFYRQTTAPFRLILHSVPALSISASIRQKSPSYTWKALSWQAQNLPRPSDIQCLSRYPSPLPCPWWIWAPWRLEGARDRRRRRRSSGHQRRELKKEEERGRRL